MTNLFPEDQPCVFADLLYIVIKLQHSAAVPSQDLLLSQFPNEILEQCFVEEIRGMQLVDHCQALRTLLAQAFQLHAPTDPWPSRQID